MFFFLFCFLAFGLKVNTYFISIIIFFLFFNGYIFPDGCVFSLSFRYGDSSTVKSHPNGFQETNKFHLLQAEFSKSQYKK